MSTRLRLKFSSARRGFVIGAVSVGASLCVSKALAVAGADPTQRVVGVTPRRDTWSLLNVNMGGFVPTWSASGDQFLGIGEGTGLEVPPAESFYGRVYRLRGDPPRPKMETLPGYPIMPLKLLPTEYAEFRNAGILAVGRRIYTMLVTPNHPYIGADGNFTANDARFAAGAGFTCWHATEPPTRSPQLRTRRRRNLDMFIANSPRNTAIRRNLGSYCRREATVPRAGSTMTTDLGPSWRRRPPSPEWRCTLSSRHL